MNTKITCICFGSHTIHWNSETVGTFHSTKISENSSSKSNGTGIFQKFVLNSECVLSNSTWSRLWQNFKTAPYHDPSAFCQEILGGKCAQAGIEWDRSGLVESTVPFDIRKFKEWLRLIKVVLWSKSHFPFFFRFWKHVLLTPNWQNFELWVLFEGC